MVLGLLPMVLLVAVDLLGCTTTHRSMSYTYPVTAEVPEGSEINSVTYRCLWNRQDADLLLSEIGTDQFAAGFEKADGLQFDASAPGHRTTRWGGLVEDRGRCSVLVVIAETESGEVLAGVVDLPESSAPVTVMLDPVSR